MEQRNLFDLPLRLLERTVRCIIGASSGRVRDRMAKSLRSALSDRSHAKAPHPRNVHNQLGDSSVRILVVNDSEQFRQLVSVILAMRQNSQVVGEASDGSEAVHKAAELKPALIILDIDLPKLNGIEAARQVRTCAPDSKIIFLSPESSSDIRA